MDQSRNVTAEISDLFETGLAHEDCRDSCLKSVFSSRRAIGHAKSARECYRKAWRLVAELWPETTDGVWHYDFDKRKVFRASAQQPAQGEKAGGAE